MRMAGCDEALTVPNLVALQDWLVEAEAELYRRLKGWRLTAARWSPRPLTFLFRQANTQHRREEEGETIPCYRRRAPCSAVHNP